MKKIMALITISLLSISMFAGCSLQNVAYNKEQDTEKYTQISDIQRLSFEVKKNSTEDFVTVKAKIQDEFENNASKYESLSQKELDNETINQLYKIGFHEAAPSDYLLFGENTYITYVKYIDSPTDLSEVRDTGGVVDAYEKCMKDGGPEILKRKTSSYTKYTDSKGTTKVISSVDVSFPMMPNKTFSGYVVLMDNTSEVSAVMFVATASPDETAISEMSYIAKSFKFDLANKGTTTSGPLNDGIGPAENNSSEPTNNESDLTTKQDSSESASIAGAKYLVLKDVSSEKAKYKLPVFKNAEYSHIDNGLVSSEIHNLELDVMTYEPTTSYTINDAKSRLTEQMESMRGFYSGEERYSDVDISEMITGENTVFFIVTAKISDSTDKNVQYSYTHIYKTDLLDNGKMLIDYELTYRPNYFEEYDDTDIFVEACRVIGVFIN